MMDEGSGGVAVAPLPGEGGLKHLLTVRDRLHGAHIKAKTGNPVKGCRFHGVANPRVARALRLVGLSGRRAP